MNRPLFHLMKGVFWNKRVRRVPKKRPQKRCVNEPPVYTPQQGPKKSPSNPFPGSKKGVFGVDFLQRNPYGTLRRVRGVGKKRPKKVCKRTPHLHTSRRPKNGPLKPLSGLQKRTMEPMACCQRLCDGRISPWSSWF